MVKIPEDMLIPESRKDTSKPENIRWLLRNIFIHNAQHPEVQRVVTDLKKALKNA